MISLGQGHLLTLAQGHLNIKIKIIVLSEITGFVNTIATGDLKLGRCRQLMKSMKMCEYSRSRSFHNDLILQDQASGERSQDQWSSGFNIY